MALCYYCFSTLCLTKVFTLVRLFNLFTIISLSLLVLIFLIFRIRCYVFCQELYVIIGFFPIIFTFFLYYHSYVSLCLLWFSGSWKKTLWVILSVFKVLLSKRPEISLRIFRLDDKLFWMKDIPDAAIVSMIQLIYEHVDPDKKIK